MAKAGHAVGHPDVVVVMLTHADDYESVACAPAGAVAPGVGIAENAVAFLRSPAFR